jgi:hypothetical protein
MLEVLVNIGGVVGLFAVFDMLARDEQKKLISAFLFVRAPVKFHAFESRVIGALMAPFVKDEALAPVRVFGLSVGAAIGLLIANLILLLFNRALLVDLDGFPWAVWCAIFVVAPVVSWPFDMISLHVTKRLFIDRPTFFPWTLFRIPVDLLASLAPVAAVMVLLLSVKQPGELPTDLSFSSPPSDLAWVVLFGSLTFNYVTTVMITILQMLTLAVGICVRGCVLMSRRLGALGRYSNMEAYPFTTVGLLAGIILALADAAV